MCYRIVFIVPPILLTLFVAGCSPSQADVERSIREEMKSGMGVTITALDIKKQADGSYLGAATAENGDVYDVTTAKPKDNKIEWKAIPGPAMVDKTVRDGLEQQLKSKVKTLQLTKHGPGNYSGPAELETGERVIVTTRSEGKQLLWEAKKADP